MYLMKVARDIVQAEHIRVRFSDKVRQKRIIQGPLGPMREMETCGIDKSRVNLTCDQETARSARGLRPRQRALWMHRIMESKDMLRVVTAIDEEELLLHDAEIAETEAELRRLRDDREKFVKAAWRRALPMLSARVAGMAEEQATEREAAA